MAGKMINLRSVHIEWLGPGECGYCGAYVKRRVVPWLGGDNQVGACLSCVLSFMNRLADELLDIKKAEYAGHLKNEYGAPAATRKHRKPRDLKG